MPNPKLAAQLAEHRNKRSRVLLDRRLGKPIKPIHPENAADRAKELHAAYVRALHAFRQAHPGASTTSPPIGSTHTAELRVAQHLYYAFVRRMRKAGVPLPKLPDLRRKTPNP